MKSLVIFIWLLAIVIATSWFFFLPGMFYLHDYLHTARVAELTRALQNLHFPVRWSENFGYGYGMPLFEFYAPLPFYVGSILALIGVPLLVVTKLLFILCNIFTTWGSYLMGKSWYGRVGGLLAAAAVSLAPYRAVNLYVRGALSEAWGIMAAVWILYFLFQTVKGIKFAWIGLTVSLVALFLSHNLLTLLFLPFSLAIAVITFVYQYTKDKKHPAKLINNMVTVLGAYLLAVGCASFYLFPAFMEKGFTQVEETITGGYFDYKLHFVYLRQFFQPNWGYGGSNWGPEDGISFFLGYGQLLALFLSLAALIITSRKVVEKKTKSISKTLWLWSGSIGVLLICSILLATEKSSWIWETVTLLQFVQFPWRFLSLSLILIGLLTPVFLYTQRSFVTRWVVGWLVLLTFFANTVFFKPETFVDEPLKYYTGDAQIIKTELSEVLPDYLPTQAQLRTSLSNSTATCLDQCTILEVKEDKVHHKVVTVEAEIPTQVQFSINYFPGWQAEINGEQVEVSEVDGLVTVAVPPGNNTVTTSFGSTPIRQISDMVSVASLVTFGLLIGIAKNKKYENFKQS